MTFDCTATPSVTSYLAGPVQAASFTSFVQSIINTLARVELVYTNTLRDPSCAPDLNSEHTTQNRYDLHCQAKDKLPPVLIDQMIQPFFNLLRTTFSQNPQECNWRDPHADENLAHYAVRTFGMVANQSGFNENKEYILVRTLRILKVFNINMMHLSNYPGANPQTPYDLFAQSTTMFNLYKSRHPEEKGPIEKQLCNFSFE